MEKENLSIGELIDTARGCAGDLTGNACVNCTFKGGDYDCTSMLLLALADKLEALTNSEATGGIEWLDVNCVTPAKDDRYLVMIAGVKKPTVLYFDTEEQGFYEENSSGTPIWCSATHWAELPEAPETAGASPRPTVEGGKEPVKRCATCRYEERMAEEERCIECEKHSLWEERK